MEYRARNNPAHSQDIFPRPCYRRRRHRSGLSPSGEDSMMLSLTGAGFFDGLDERFCFFVFLRLLLPFFFLLARGSWCAPTLLFPGPLPSLQIENLGQVYCGKRVNWATSWSLTRLGHFLGPRCLHQKESHRRCHCSCDIVHTYKRDTR